MKATAEIEIVQPATDAERIAPPPPGPAVRTIIPSPISARLANGLTIVTVPRNDIPLATAQLVSSRGAAGDPEGKGGLARIMAQLTTKGTATRSATDIASSIEALGGTLNANADYDASSLGLTVKSDQLSPALAILADVARNPAFANEEIERQRGINIDEVSVALQDPGAISRLVANRALYGIGAYGQPAIGTPASLKAITREDIVSAYKAAFTPDRATLIVTGAVDPAEAKALAEKHFGDWKSSGVVPADRPTAQEGTLGRVIVIDMPGAGQAALAVIKPGIARNDPRFYPLAVANNVLGGGYSSRLNQEIRIKRGLAYGAGSGIEARRRPGPAMANTQTKNESAPEVLGLILGEMQRLGAEPIPASELGTRKAVLNGSFGRSLETTASLATTVSNYVAQGVALDELLRYQQAIDQVTPAQAGSAAQAVLAPAGATVVIVGDASKFADRLRRERGEITIIPLDKLDLQRIGEQAR